MSYPHDIFGEGIYAYITLKQHADSTADGMLIPELKALVKKKIAHYAIPHRFLVSFIQDIYNSLIDSLKVASFILKAYK